DRERMAAACADPLLRAADAAETLVKQGVPFRDAHEQVAAQVRAGTFEPPPPGERLGDVKAAVQAAKERWSGRRRDPSGAVASCACGTSRATSSSRCSISPPS